ncbi:hypothetical protein ACSBR2_016487 [Camellia fascicularis]
MKEDCTRVSTRGPWIILDHYLTVQKWKHDFKPSAAKEISTTLWVRFPQLLIEYYNEKILYHIAKSLGKPLKIGINTTTSSRGKYAQVCIEVDLSKSLISYYSIGKYSYAIEYEHLHSICFNYSRAGHRKEWYNTSPMKTKDPAKVLADGSKKVTVVNSEQWSSIYGVGPSANGSAELSNEGFGPWMLVKKKCKRSHHLGRGREDNKLGKRPQNANQIRWGLRPIEQTDNPNPYMLPSGKISTPLEKMLIVG